MLRYLVILCLAVVLLGCGESFEAGGFGGEDAGTGGNAGEGGTNTGGNAGEGGTNTGGNAGEGGTGGNTGGNGGQGGAGGSNPCPSLTYQQAATEIGQPCANLFGNSKCSTNGIIPRDEFIVAVITSVVTQAKKDGYTDPSSPTFSDVLVTSPIEVAVWLDILPKPLLPTFDPGDPTDLCFAQDVLTAVNSLPDKYAVVIYNELDDTVGSGGGPVPATNYDVYGTSPGSHLTQLVRLVNNLTADFTVPQSTTALEAVRFRCEVPTGGSFTTYSLPLTAGAADFNTLDCYNQAGGAMEVQLQVDPDSGGGGQMARIGIDPTTLTVRRGPGGTQADTPTFTIN